MIQYKFEGNFNFNEELMKLLCENTKCEEKKCLISGDKLGENIVKLECGHTFNYNSIFNEVVNQRKINTLEVQKISNRQIKCPYCRTIHNGILPYIDGYKKILHVNVENYIETLNICEAVLKSGKRKGQKCNF